MFALKGRGIETFISNFLCSQPIEYLLVSDKRKLYCK